MREVPKTLTLIQRTVNKDDAIQLSGVLEQEEHLLRAVMQSLFYKEQCTKVRELYEGVPEERLWSQHKSECSFNGDAHIHLDYAQ